MAKKNSTEKAAREWLDLKEEKTKIETRMTELKGVLEPWLEGEPDRAAEIHGFKFSLVHQERETFRLSEAKEKIELRVLKPFITVSSFSQIRTLYRGGEKEAA